MLYFHWATKFVEDCPRFEIIDCCCGRNRGQFIIILFRTKWNNVPIVSSICLPCRCWYIFGKIEKIFIQTSNRLERFEYNHINIHMLIRYHCCRSDSKRKWGIKGGQSRFNTSRISWQKFHRMHIYVHNIRYLPCAFILLMLGNLTGKINLIFHYRLDDCHGFGCNYSRLWLGLYFWNQSDQTLRTRFLSGVVLFWIKITCHYCLPLH